jgi:hypothetical protein
MHTMADSKDDIGLLNGLFHLDTFVDVSSHRLLAQEMVSLFSKRENDLDVHVILHSDYERVCEALSSTLDAVLRSLVQILPGIEYEACINFMSVSEQGTRFWTRLCDCYNLAFRGI